MTIEELKEAISNVVSTEGCGAEFFFLLGGEQGTRVKTVDMGEDVQAELTGMFVDSVSNNILLNDDLSLVDLSSADDRINAIYHYDLEDVPGQLQQLRTVIDTESFEPFNFASDDLAQLKGILVLLGNHEAQLAIYKHQYPVALLKKDSGFSLRRALGSNRFQKLDEDILKINSKFEFIKINGQYYILDLKTLERFFGFHEAIKNVAKQGVENIAAVDIVQDISVLANRIDDIAFSRKLVKSARNSPVLGVIPNSTIVSFADTHPALRGKFKTSEDRTKFDLNTKKSQNLFLKLLNDDFLQSELTRRYYDSIAKDTVEVAPKESAE